MRLRSVKSLKKLKNKPVLLRLDLDLPLGADGKIGIGEDERLWAGLPTVKLLLRQGARLVIAGHLGRPGGQNVPGLRLSPVVARLAQLLGAKTGISQERLGQFDAYMFRLDEQEIFILENLRFWPGEERNDKLLAKNLAGLANYFVNEAFADSHREHASIVGVTKFLPSYAGLRLGNEVKVLSKVLKRPARPLTLIIGGVKAETKLKLAEKFIPRADFVLAGSAIANNFYQSLGFDVGNSKLDSSLRLVVERLIRRPLYRIIEPSQDNILLPVEKNITWSAKQLLGLRKRIILPFDLAIGSSSGSVGKSATRPQIRRVGVKSRPLATGSEQILDVGPETIELYCQIIKRSKTIVWNGPLGLFEQPPFDRGTFEVAQAVAACRGKGIIGGGDTIAAINSEKIKFRQNIFISSGGGAMLEFLLNPRLPGIGPLLEK